MERNNQVQNRHLVTPSKIIDLGTDDKEMLRKEDTNTDLPYRKRKG